MRKNRVSDKMRQEARTILEGWTSYDVSWISALFTGQPSLIYHSFEWILIFALSLVNPASLPQIAKKSRVCVLFFIWCKEICDLNNHPEDNPLLPVIIGRFNRRAAVSNLSQLALSRGSAMSGRASGDLLPGEEPRMVHAAARLWKRRMPPRPPALPPVTTAS